MKHEIYTLENGYLYIERSGDLVYRKLVFKSKAALLKCLTREIEDVPLQ